MALLMRNLADSPERWALNTATLGYRQPFPDVVEAVARAGYGAISPWRSEVEAGDAARLRRRIRDAGLRVAGYCRSAYLTHADTAERAENERVNCAAIDTAAALGAECFVLVVGSLPAGARDLVGARRQVADGIAHLTEHARQAGTRLALEPLHPMYCGDRACINTLAQALDLVEQIEGTPAQPILGVAIDAYHVWWDPDLPAQVARAGAAGRIFGYHVSDWLVPTRDLLMDRGMMGDGVIDLRRIRQLVEAAGYSRSVEVEIFSQDWWRRDPIETLQISADRLKIFC